MIKVHSKMVKLRAPVFNFVQDNKAVTALEYGIIASILGLVLVGIFSNFGSTLTALFGNVSTSI